MHYILFAPIYKHTLTACHKYAGEGGKKYRDNIASLFLKKKKNRNSGLSKVAEGTGRNVCRIIDVDGITIRRRPGNNEHGDGENEELNAAANP